MIEKFQILGKKIEKNEYGIMTIQKLTEEYNFYEGRKFDVEYVYTLTYKNGFVGKTKKFKSLANAMKYCISKNMF